MTPELVDTHAHIQASEFDEDVEKVIERAHQAGVTSMVVPAVDTETARGAIALAEAHDRLFATAGYHPHEASHLDDAALAQTESLLAHEKVVAVGEIGLDYFRLHSTREEQLAAMGKMLALAERHKMPIVVHCRDAWDDMALVLGPWARRASGAFAGQPLGVMHYFTGTLDQARRYIELGFLISVHTSVTHPKSAPLREVVAELPLQALVIETDSPYGAPQAYRGKRNQPSYVVEAAKQIAELKDVSLDEVADTTSANARRLFRLPVPVGTRGSGI